MARRKRSAAPEPSLDLNGDGVVDEKDKSIAGKVLASKASGELVEEAPAPAEKPAASLDSGDRVALRDISLLYRKGMMVPRKVVEKWAEMGIDVDKMVK